MSVFKCLLYNRYTFCVIPGQHRFFGTGISQVRSMKLDSSIWSNELIEVTVIFLMH